MRRFLSQMFRNLSANQRFLFRDLNDTGDLWMNSIFLAAHYSCKTLLENRIEKYMYISKHKLVFQVQEKNNQT